MTSVTILLTCHNRKEKTERCIRSIHSPEIFIRYIITDDGSTDGTAEMLAELQKSYHISVIAGDGKLFWSGGMHRAIEYALKEKEKTDYYVLVNDDVSFFEDVLKDTIEKSRVLQNAVVAGATCDEKGGYTYGGICYHTKGVSYDMVMPGENNRCDTFNCNFVLIPQVVFLSAGNFDEHYRHSMADFDYGLRIKKLGYQIYSTEKYVGICKRNLKKGTWQDNTLPRKQRLKNKELPKGLPGREWFYFLNKNFGLREALWHSLTPYLRILIGK